MIDIGSLQETAAYRDSSCLGLTALSRPTHSSVAIAVKLQEWLNGGAMKCRRLFHLVTLPILALALTACGGGGGGTDPVPGGLAGVYKGTVGSQEIELEVYYVANTTADDPGSSLAGGY